MGCAIQDFRVLGLGFSVRLILYIRAWQVQLARNQILSSWGVRFRSSRLDEVQLPQGRQ